MLASCWCFGAVEARCDLSISSHCFAKYMNSGHSAWKAIDHPVRLNTLPAASCTRNAEVTRAPMGTLWGIDWALTYKQGKSKKLPLSIPREVRPRHEVVYRPAPGLVLLVHSLEAAPVKRRPILLGQPRPDRISRSAPRASCPVSRSLRAMTFSGESMVPHSVGPPSQVILRPRLRRDFHRTAPRMK
jgi:hypothetical protein